MKVAILTFSKEINYGAELQCFALKTMLEKLHHEVSVIDIQLPLVKRSLINRLLHFPEKIYFSIFWNKHIGSFTRKYFTEQEIMEDPPKADVYIVGSDQVWNPEITQRLSPLIYFFNFIKNDSKRVSYAASFGFETWTDEILKPQVRILIQKFSAVSVRENDGINICNETFGVNAVEVCDPTQLLTSADYEKICGPFNESKKSNHILYWKQIRNNHVENEVLDFADSIGKKVLKICDLRLRKRCLNKPFVTIKQWLNVIRYSDFIVTDSFHGLSFCLIFRRPFAIIYDLDTRGNRIKSILNLIGLQDRLVTSVEELRKHLTCIYNKKIDFDLVNAKLNEKKKFSLEFIRSALK
jgi:hypothetical protein